MSQPREPEIDPALEEHLFGEVEDTRPVKRMRVARERKEIQLGPDLRRVADECIEAISKDPRTFSRAYELVTVVGAPPDGEKTGIAPDTPTIRPIAAVTLRERLTDFARCVKYNSQKDSWEEQPAPIPIVSQMLERGDWAGVRRLAGVVEVPIFRANGTIRQERGYDAETGYVYLPSANYPEIKPHPTQDDARAALETLEHVFCDFPYVSRAHRMVPIAAILTMIARAAIAGPVPAFLFDASTRGSGKTLQADVVHLVAFGRSAGRKTYPDEDDELEKVLSSYALSGARAILLDNVTRPFGGGPIDLCITARDDVELRVLGKSEIRRLPWHAVIMVSGNNLVCGEDTLRRVLVARLESPHENPETRTDFVHPDLTSWVLLNRPALVAAALTILRAHAVIGFASAGCPRWGSFEAWSRIVPNALVYAGGEDPMGARPRGEGAMTDDLMALAVILRELPRLVDTGVGLTAKGILALLWPHDREDNAPPDGFDTLREAIETWTVHRSNQRPTPSALGRKLSGYEGRVLGAKRLRSRVLDGRRLWTVEGTQLALPTT